MTTATLVYEAPQGFATIAALTARLAAVPLPLAAIAALGGIVTSDTTGSGGLGVQRQIVIRLTPTVASLAHVTLSPGTPSGSFIDGTVIDNAGQGLVLPPQVVLTGGGNNVIRQGKLQAFLNVRAVALAAGGLNYTANTFAAVIGAMRPPTGPFPSSVPLCVQSLKLVSGGKGYTTAAIVQFEGGLGPGGVHATAVCTVGAVGGPQAGEVTSITLLTPGKNYNAPPQVFIYNPTTRVRTLAKVVPRMGVGTPATVTVAVAAPPGPITGLALATSGDGYIGIPQLVITDPGGTGSGVQASLDMQLGRIDIIDAGRGYNPAPTVTLKPVFDVYFPTGTDRAAPFREFMSSAFAQASVGPIRALPPVVV